ncbi:MAG: GNAT family N-acetyltransferase [Alphaproteobacteria bacterium]|nr:GNAT family N-acetyltransferase [Alphaproteobacteria bacterium]
MKAERLTANDIEAIRTVRLEGLKNHPENFGADYDFEAAQPIEWSLQRMSRAATFGVKIDGALAGICVFYRETEKKHRHQGGIGAVYVRPQYRGQGVGDALVKAALEEAVRQGVEHVSLTVTATNPGAVRLYERNGFTVTGKMPANIRVGTIDYDELIMHRRVSNSD